MYKSAEIAMNKIWQNLSTSFIQSNTELISARPLSIFRILFAFTLLLEAIQIYSAKEIFFLSTPLVETLNPSDSFQLGLWIFVLIFLVFGFMTPLLCLANYYFVLKFLIGMNSYSYHADYIYHSIGFISLFLPLNRYYSLDQYFSLKFLRIDLRSLKSPRLYNNLVLFFCAGFMYFDSTVYKLESKFWLDGLGLWVPASHPSFTFLNWNWLLNQKLLMQILSYTTVFFEITFVFLLWFKRLRLPLLILGLGLHFGIGIILPIPLFALIMCTIYVNFLPINSANPMTTLFTKLEKSDQETFAPINRTDRFFLFFEKARFVFLSSLFSILFFVQLLLAFNVSDIIPNKIQISISYYTSVTPHRVFGSWQFTSMKREVSIQFIASNGKVHWINYINESGYAGFESYAGRFWSSWWALSLPTSSQPKDAWAKAIEVWAVHNHVNLAEGYGVVQERSINRNLAWEEDRQISQTKKPWTKILKIEWIEKQRIFSNEVNNYFPPVTK